MIVRTCSLTEVLAIHRKIPELEDIADVAYLRSRVGDRVYIALAVELNGEVVGYKLGYWLMPKRFYSWLGGVMPKHRKRGAATALLQHQEKHVLAQGGEEIVVKSMNRYPNMLVMLIVNHYQITGCEGGAGKDIKVIFSKRLTQ